MKRILLAALAVIIAVVVLAPLAEAAGSVRYKSAGLMRFRTHLAAVVGNETPNHGVDASGGFVDTLGYYMPTNDVFDTSAVFILPNDFCQASSSDSMPPVVLVWRGITAPNDNTAKAFGSGDSSYAKVQVMVGQSLIDQVAGAPTAAMAAIQGTAGFGMTELFKAAPASAAAVSQTSPRQVYFLPAFGLTREFRVITYSDGSALAAGNAFVQCEVLYSVCQ